MLERIFYRIRQFGDALHARPIPEELKLIQAHLSPAQMELFLAMPASDQAHSLKVFKSIYHQSLFEQEAARADLLVAALLHDVGKSRYKLQVWERAMIVLAKLLIPEQVRRWGEVHHDRQEMAGNGDHKFGWRKAFVIAEQHPRWGAEMAAAAGASRLTVELIQRHQDLLPENSGTIEEQLLRRFQLLDDNL